MIAHHKSRLAISILVFVVLVLITPASLPARAAGPWYVTPGGSDSNDCLSPANACATINGALNKPGFVAGDTILLATGTYTGTGSSEVVLLDKSATHSGGWNALFTAQTGTSTIDGQSARRGIRINIGVTATVERLVIQNGSASNGLGGGIYNDGTLTLANSTVTGNTASDFASGLGIYNTGTMIITNSMISNNSAGFYMSSGAGIFNDIGATLTLNNSAVTGNTAWGHYGGGIYNAGTLSLNNSTVSGNTASFGGGGIFNNEGFLILNNSTLSGNIVGPGTSSSDGGGIYTNSGIVILNNSTLSGNAANSYGGNNGGGIYIYNATVTLRNTILARNVAATASSDCYGSINSAGYNLIGNTSGCTFSASAGDLTNIDPSLGPLQNNSGATLTHALLLGSPAINAGNPAGCTDSLGNPLNADQRGMPRIGRCDIGAYEYQGVVHQVFVPAVTRNFCPTRFFDDFSNPASGWPIVDTGNVRYEYLDGEYRILLRNAYWWAGATPDVIAANDYNVSVDVRNASGVYGSYGFMFGVSSDGGQFYTFEIDPDGFWVIWRFDAGSGWTLLAIDSSGSIATGTATNHLKLERNGALMNVYANGVLLASLSDGAYTGERGVGVFVTSYDQGNVDVRFDNFDLCGRAATVNAAREMLEGEAAEIVAASHRQSERDTLAVTHADRR